MDKNIKGRILNHMCSFILKNLRPVLCHNYNSIAKSIQLRIRALLCFWCAFGDVRFYAHSCARQNEMNKHFDHWHLDHCRFILPCISMFCDSLPLLSQAFYIFHDLQGRLNSSLKGKKAFLTCFLAIRSKCVKVTFSPNFRDYHLDGNSMKSIFSLRGIGCVDIYIPFGISCAQTIKGHLHKSHKDQCGSGHLDLRMK